MRNIAILTVLTAALAGAAAYAEDGDSSKGTAKAAATAPAPAAASATDVKDSKWSPLDPSQPKGPQVSVITGDMKAGPVYFLLKMPAGMKAPVHTHTSDYHGVVVSGAPAHGDTEASAKVHAPGSTWFEPAKHPHYDGCTSKEDCVVALYYEHGFDFTPVEATKTAAAASGKKTK